MENIFIDGGYLYLIDVVGKTELVLFDEHVELKNNDEEIIIIFEDSEKRDDPKNELHWLEYSYICINDEVVYLSEIFDGVNPIGEY